RPKSARGRAYGAHQYHCRLPDSSDSKRKAVDLEGYGHRLFIARYLGAMDFVESLVHELRLKNFLSLDEQPAFAVITDSHSRVREGLIEAGASDSITGFLTNGPVTLNEDRIKRYLALCSLGNERYTSFYSVWPFHELAPEHNVAGFLDELSTAGLHDLWAFVNRSQKAKELLELDDRYGRYLAELNLFTEAEIADAAAEIDKEL